MRFALLFCLFASGVIHADTLRVTVDGMGCRTRQLAVQRLWAALPEVESVTIIPRKPEDPANQRVFLLETNDPGLDQNKLIAALGRRAKHYQILTLERSPGKR